MSLSLSLTSITTQVGALHALQTCMQWTSEAHTAPSPKTASWETKGAAVATPWNMAHGLGTSESAGGPAMAWQWTGHRS